MQVSFALHELTTEGQYAGLWQILRTTDDIWTATDKVCRLYEQPYYCNVDTRFRYAKELEDEISKVERGASTQPSGEMGPQSEPGEGHPTLNSFRDSTLFFFSVHKFRAFDWPDLCVYSSFE